jgi:hypothetical protein
MQTSWIRIQGTGLLPVMDQVGLLALIIPELSSIQAHYAGGGSDSIQDFNIFWISEFKRTKPGTVQPIR